MGEIELLVGGVSGMSLGGRSGRSRRLVANCKAFCWVGEVGVALLVLLSWMRSLAKLKACSCDGEMELFIVLLSLMFLQML